MTEEKAVHQLVTTAAPAPQALPPAVRGQQTSNGTPQIIINVPTGGTKDGPADILNGVAAVLWPLLIALIIFLFRDQIVSLVRRIRKGKAFGAEAEFDKELEALNREVNKAKEETAAGLETQTIDKPNAAVVTQTEGPPDGSARVDIKAKVLAEAARSPRLGIMLLSAEIDKLAGRIAASTGHDERRTLREQLALWNSQLPPHTSAAYRLFSHVRNRIVHGRDASEAEILSALDSGFALYDALASIPIERNVVVDLVDIFGDADAKLPLEGKGLLMQTTHEGNTLFRIFPTTGTYYRPGMRLTWKWNMGRIWPAAWYRDHVTGEIKEAWRSSAEFVGTDLDQL